MGIGSDGKTAKAPAEVVQKFFVRIKADKLVWDAGSLDWEHTIKLDPKAKPKAMDLHPLHGAAGLQELQAIYEVDGDQL